MKIRPYIGFGVTILFLISTDFVFSQAVPRTDGLPESKSQRYLEMRRRLPTVEVDGIAITHGQVEERMRTLRRADMFSVHRKYEEMKPAAFRLAARDQIIDEVLALREAKKRGIGLGQGEAEAVAARFLPNDPDQAKSKLDRHGLLDRRMLLDQIGRNTIIDKLRAQITADLPEPTTEAMRAFYEANSRVFEVTPERVLAREIMIVKPKEVKTRSPEYAKLLERTDRLIDLLEEGADFGQLADRNTENPAGIGNGGSLGWVKRGGRTDELKKALFTQKVGVIPDRAIRTVGGLHILLIEDKKPPVQQPFEEAIPRIQRGLKIERFKQWLAESRRNADIVYYKEMSMKSVLEGKMPEKTDRRF